jgi:hypothetical protein
MERKSTPYRGVQAIGALTEYEDVKCSCYSGEWDLYQEAPSERGGMIYTTGLAAHGHQLVISRRFNTNNGSVVYVYHNGFPDPGCIGR